MEYVWAALLLLTLVAGWLLTVFTLPGTWLMVLAAAVYAWLMPPGSPVSIGWGVVVALLVLAALGEFLELIAGALGARRGGGSKRAAVLAVLGSIPGALLGAVVGLPVPVVGQLIAIVLFAGVGALAGAMLGEWWKGRTWDESWQVGQGAFWGRLLGTVAKVVVASSMVAVGTIAVLWP